MQNTCECNPNTFGNPYIGCSKQNKITCNTASCGKNAECHDGLNKIDCTCPSGYKGNPYVKCEDIDECSSNMACGNGAICINTLGSYDCRCKSGFTGNPFLLCLPLQKDYCDDASTCQCTDAIQCPSGYACINGGCSDLCENTRCGPKAICDSGKCICPAGFIGDPFDLIKGCTLRGQCSNDVDCKTSEICFQFSKGVRKCVDGCSKLQCGPNALCVSNDHTSTCICAEGYYGNPGDLFQGCQAEKRVATGSCKTNADCTNGDICYLTDLGVHSCINPCSAVACGTNELCIVEGSNPVCHCKENFIWNPLTSVCEKPSIPDCSTDNDCHQVAACKKDVLGVLKCTKVCAQFTCPLNSVCVATNHRGSCQCLPGFSGNPNDRNGCRTETKNKCETSAECAESEKCINYAGSMACRPACEDLICGASAICVTNNHVAQCQCPPGSFTGNPYDVTSGCKSVPCVYNIDCPSSQLCNRMTYTCINVCEEDTCGDNAICIAEDHKSNCQCPQGFRPNPIADVECAPFDSCNINSCHSSAICETSPNGYICKCPDNLIGDPYSTGCIKQGQCSIQTDCPGNTICLNGHCTDICDGACGINSVCKVINGNPVCTCPKKLTPLVNGDARDGCGRSETSCISDRDCDGVCLNGQCKAVCRNANDCMMQERCENNMCVQPCAGHSQCTDGQACVNGNCIFGCRSNRDCAEEFACINNKCQDPCDSEGVCGPNAVCSCKNHVTSCHCPTGFDAFPVPEQGCVRVSTKCTSTSQCSPGLMCIANQCNLPCRDTTDCASGERCFNSVCSKVCYDNNYCLPGEICNNAGTCQTGCVLDTDCPDLNVCFNNKCKCSHGYIGTPYGCEDIDECSDNPCHATATCVNTPGSYKCLCSGDTVGDPYSDPGCIRPNECYSNNDCENNLYCKDGKCTDACAHQKCGTNAICEVFNHIAACTCPIGHLGDPLDESIGCFKVECLNNDDCISERACHLDSHKCVNPCDLVDCGKGSCSAEEHTAVCTCFTGFQLVNGVCDDIDECLGNPCHTTAKCENTYGNFICSCPEGLIGDPISVGCRNPSECFENSDCPETASCIESRCKNPCEDRSSCGKNAICSPLGHRAICQCPVNTVGDPKLSCEKIECSENNDCSSSETCIDFKCINPCSLPNACGQNADCFNENHVGICSCKPGMTGSPLLGCVSIQYCSTDHQCTAGTKCNAGICSAVCTNTRECIENQMCIQNICQPTCTSNSTCPDFQYCLNNICTQEFKCRSDEDCDIDEVCVTDNNGRSNCENACIGRVICGRNAECASRNHEAVCTCKPGFYADNNGCRKIECETDSDCSNDKTCENYMCKIACLLGDRCGENAICLAENHKQVCYCQPGYTGDPTQQCILIDVCKDGPCASGATCKNIRGAVKCTCPVGFVGEPYKEGCKIAVECHTNEDCPNQAICSTENGVPKCRDVCASMQCGPNADCSGSDHTAFCSCREGFEGDASNLLSGCQPKPISCGSSRDCPENSYCYNEICRPVCTLTTECSGEEICQNGQCLNPCDQPQACGMNAKCSIRSRVKQCSCPPGFTGTPDVECVRSMY